MTGDSTKSKKEEIDAEEVEEENEQAEENRNVSIKGVSKDLYKRINEIAHDTGKTMGEITNEAYKVFASTLDGAKTVSKSFISGAWETGVQIIVNLKELEISGDELKDFKRKVLFRNINRLVLQDVTDEDIQKRIHSFVHIDELVVPRSIKKAVVLTKCTYVSRITQK